MSPLGQTRSVPPPIKPIIKKKVDAKPINKPSSCLLPRASSAPLRVVAAVGACTMQNARPHQEDTNTAHDPIYFGGKLYLAVCDGHGGARVAKFITSNFRAYLLSNDGDVQAALAALNTAVLKEDYAMKSGSTCIVAEIAPGFVHFYNVGDSRGIVVDSSSSKVVMASKDHKPTDPLERKRINDAGGTVGPYPGHNIRRLKENNARRSSGTPEDKLQKEEDLAQYLSDGVHYLGPSRSLGDGRINPKVLSSKAEKTTLVRDLNGKVVILATDGLWDVFDNDTVAKLSARLLAQGRTKHNLSDSECAGMIARCLAKMAAKQGSGDNVTVVAVVLA